MASVKAIAELVPSSASAKDTKYRRKLSDSERLSFDQAIHDANQVYDAQLRAQEIKDEFDRKYTELYNFIRAKQAEEASANKRKNIEEARAGKIASIQKARAFFDGEEV